MIHEQKQRSSAPPRGASRQYRIYSDNAQTGAASLALRAASTPHLARLDENRWVASRGLKSARDHIDVERIQLDAATDATGFLGGDEGGAGRSA